MVSTKSHHSVLLLCILAILAAMSFALGLFAKWIFGMGFLRITFENLPIIFSGAAFGPLAGGTVACISDLLSCLMSGQPINPLIFIGSVSIGVVSGIFSYIFRGRNKWFPFLLIELISQIIGSVIIKSAALHLYFGYAVVALLPRIPLYVCIAVAESFCLYILFQNAFVQKTVVKALGRNMK